MVANLTYRTADPTRWGGGNGTDLIAQQVDLNFWTLFEAVTALENGSEAGAGIDFINQPSGGNTFFIHLTNHAVLGPFTIPTTEWNPRGVWQPLTSYAAFDVVSQSGNLYLVTVSHTSAATFNAFATDGNGHTLYALILSSPANSLPAGGKNNQKLVKIGTTDFVTAWANDLIRMALFVEGQPNPSELLMQFLVADNMTLPVGLAGSVVFAGVQTQSTVIYTLTQIPLATGIPAVIGTITFNGPSPEDIVVSFTAAISFVPGDVLTLTAPVTPDAAQANISFTLLATVN